MPTVRFAREKDIPAIMELLVQVDMVHHQARPDLFKGPATKYTPEELRAILTDAQRPVFVCVDEKDQVLGHAFCIFRQWVDHPVMTDVKSLYIDDLCVHERCRGQHIGSLLYSHIQAFARQSGCYSITLNVWAQNESALAFYRRMGLNPQKIVMETIL